MLLSIQLDMFRLIGNAKILKQSFIHTTHDFWMNPMKLVIRYLNKQKIGLCADELPTHKQMNRFPCALF